ncbi:MAG: S8 family serine peptidase [Clostridia bacterium]|nr:S8 family serine peptidase [Clostridia bacterium]
MNCEYLNYDRFARIEKKKLIAVIGVVALLLITMILIIINVGMQLVYNINRVYNQKLINEYSSAVIDLDEKNTGDNGANCALFTIILKQDSISSCNDNACCGEDIHSYIHNDATIYDKYTQLSGTRNEQKIINSNINSCFIADYSISTLGDYEYSEYAPYIRIKFKSIMDYERNLDSLKLITFDERVENVYLNNNYSYIDSASYNSDSYTKGYSYETALDDIGFDRNATNYNGTSIRVGMIESRVPTDAYVDSSVYRYYLTSGTTSQQIHPNIVSSIMRDNTYGIAPSITLFCAALADFSLSSCINYLLNNNVSIINMSAASMQQSGVYTYSADSVLVDSITKNSNVLFVGAAGNGADTNEIVSTPSDSVNALAVGATDYNGNMSYFSSYNNPTVSNISIHKPSLVAPGGNLYMLGNYGYGYNTNVDQYGNYNCISGTSFSTPMVTGIAALLQQEFPMLIDDPELLLSVLTSSAVKLTSQTDVFDEHAGAGMVSYEKARQVAASVVSVHVSNAYNDDYEVACRTITLPSQNTLKISVYWLASSSSTPVFNKYKIQLVNTTTNNNIGNVITSQINWVATEYTNSSNSDITIDIQIKTDGARTNAIQDTIVTGFYCDFGAHAHAYNTLVDYCSNSHTTQCWCGRTLVSSHNFACLDNGDGTHAFACSVCGISGGGTSSNHSMSCVSNSSITHSYMCNACNYIESTSTHNCTYNNNGNGTHYKYCSQCGYSVNVAHTLMYAYRIGMAAEHNVLCTKCAYSTVEACVFGANGCIKCGRTDGFDPNSQPLVPLWFKRLQEKKMGV